MSAENINGSISRYVSSDSNGIPTVLADSEGTIVVTRNPADSGRGVAFVALYWPGGSGHDAGLYWYALDVLGMGSAFHSAE